MMKSLIFSSFCILRSKNTQAAVKWVLKKKKKIIPCHSVHLVWKQSVKKASSQINLQASVWISFIRIITSIWKIKRLQQKGINSSYLMLCETLSFSLTLSSIASTNGDLLGFIFLTLIPIKNPQNKYKTKTEKLLLCCTRKRWCWDIRRNEKKCY